MEVLGKVRSATVCFTLSRDGRRNGEGFPTAGGGGIATDIREPDLVMDYPRLHRLMARRTVSDELCIRCPCLVRFAGTTPVACPPAGVARLSQRQMLQGVELGGERCQEAPPSTAVDGRQR